MKYKGNYKGKYNVKYKRKHINEITKENITRTYNTNTKYEY